MDTWVKKIHYKDRFIYHDLALSKVGEKRHMEEAVAATRRKRAALMRHEARRSLEMTPVLPTIVTNAHGGYLSTVIIQVMQQDNQSMPPKKWTKRPEYWRDIVDYYYLVNRSVSSTKSFYRDEFKDVTEEQLYHRLRTWCRDYSGNKNFQRIGAKPICGEAIDRELYDSVKQRIKNGLPIDGFILKQLFRALLLKHGKESLLNKYTFGTSWANRFYNRWKLRRRAVTTKMREQPDDLAEKRETFTRIATAILRESNVPAELVINCDETGILFISRANYTYALQGAKRVRAIGVGKEKPQYTATLAVTESGNVLSTQLIFKGKTNAAHPGGKDAVPPDGIYFDHTESHWQTVKSYLDYLQKVILPYKTNVIRELSLPENQKCILKHDLHYSHKDQQVLDYMREHNIIPLYVPAGCTDWMQECDVVVNASFKRVIREAFRDHLYKEFDDHMAIPGNSIEEWAPNLNVGYLKKHVPGWIIRGINSLKETRMKQSIIDAFTGPGCIGEARRRVAEEHFEVLRVQELLGQVMLGNEVESAPEEIGLPFELEIDNDP